eukprot:jgi/Mesen1/2532/ME000161S01585
MVVGIVMGSGIFASPGVVLQDVGSVGMALVTWVVAGVVAYASSLLYAELGSAIPHAGGDGEYLRVCSMPCPLLLLLLLLSWLQNALTLTKTLLVLLIVVAAAAFVAQDARVAHQNASTPFDASSWRHVGPGLIAAIWAFDGWSCIVYLSEELVEPARDLPRCIAAAMATVAAVYVVLNIAYLCVLPAQEVKSTQVVAVLTVQRALGGWAARVTALLVAANVLGCANGSLMATSRYLYAAARQGQLPRPLAAVLPNGAPAASLVAVGVWTSVVLAVSSNDLEKLLDYFGIAAWVFYAAVAAALIHLRRTRPDMCRPYRACLYPATPLLLILIAVFLITTSLLSNIIPSLVSLALIVLGFPVYFMCFQQKAFNGESMVRGILGA